MTYIPCFGVDIFRLAGTTSEYFQLPWCSKNGTNCSTISFKIALRPLNQLTEYGNASLTVATILFKCLHIKDIDEKLQRSKNAEEFFPIFSIDVKSDSQIYCIRVHVHKKNIFSYPCKSAKSPEDYIYCRCDGNGLFSFMITGHSDSYFLFSDYLHPRLYLVTAGIIIFFVVLQNVLRTTWRLKKTDLDRYEPLNPEPNWPPFQYLNSRPNTLPLMHEIYQMEYNND
ncbi:hypothetical protein TNCT_187142 [Trichonephila clavata]|uniref:Uncharacterized protein n=1 Tax=Trichonephila clavata TaxID=2740835 RepID=A0A8X6HB03_TRICU|nr:hypothetical protein TNCT_187142 [Trichonephila clavata]